MITERASLLAAREKRLADACSLRPSERVPVAPLVHYFPAVRRGLERRVMHYDLALRNRLLREVVEEYDWDAAPPAAALPEGRPLELIGATQYSLPGWGLQDSQPFQFVEGEYMLQQEYDELLADPHGFVARKIWPRVAEKLALVSTAVIDWPRLLPYSADARGAATVLGSLLADRGAGGLETSLGGSLNGIEALPRETAAADAAISSYVSEMTSLGYPLLFGATALTAFDCVSDFLRGLKGTLLDMYQVPHKLLAAIELLTPWTVEEAVMAARRTGNSRVFIALHRGAGGFMSNEQFAKFYWPSLRALLLGLIDAGLTPLAFFEGDYTPRLGFLSELPPGKIIGHFDRVDRTKAKQALGKVMCFWGNVPSSLFCAGTPEEVKRDVWELVSLFGEDGGLILDGNVGIPDEASPQNVRAFTEAARESAAVS